MQFFACWTGVDIARCFIAELIWAKEGGVMVVIRKGNVRVNMLSAE
jgi:hypothetical protein